MTDRNSIQYLKARQAEGVPIIVCDGMGVDSTAVLIGLHRAGLVPDLITFADTGGEKQETYDYIEIQNAWLREVGFPEVTVCRKATLDSTPYNDLGGNCYHNETLPSLAFGMKSCSIKWKQGPQDYVLKGCKSGPNKQDPHPLWIHAQALGVKPIKVIGYDNGPADLRRSGKLKGQDADFEYSYPLQSWGWERDDCVKTIIDAGLPVPVKSACFFCPASQKWELWWLAGTDPDRFMAALEIEHRAMVGKHSRWGSEECTYDRDWIDLCNQPGDRWPQIKITVGLGRSFAWNHWARENGIVDKLTGEFIADREYCIKMAEGLRKDGGNAQDGRTC